MKLSNLVLGGQSFLFAAVFAVPFPGGTSSITARDASPVAAPFSSFEAATMKRGEADEDLDNVICAKVKRAAEASAEAASMAFSSFEATMTKRGEADEDLDNVICAKAKRAAEASAEAASTAFNSFEAAMTKRGEADEDLDNVICAKAKRDAMAAAEMAATAYQGFATALARGEDINLRLKAKREAKSASGLYKRFAGAISQVRV